MQKNTQILTFSLTSFLIVMIFINVLVFPASPGYIWESLKFVVALYLGRKIYIQKRNFSSFAFPALLIGFSIGLVNAVFLLLNVISVPELRIYSKFTQYILIALAILTEGIIFYLQALLGAFIQKILYRKL